MGFWEKAWEWLKKHFGGAKQPIIINIINDPEKGSYNVSVDGSKVDINFTKLEQKQKEEFAKLLREDAFEKEGYSILESSATKRVEDITAKIDLKDIKDILNYYKDKIPPTYLPILEMALYLRKVFLDGENIDELKQDLYKKYGTEGRNIANLCTGGYFETTIKEAYEEMSGFPDFKPEKFYERFEEIVTTQPFAVFVHREMDEKEIEHEIGRKLTAHRKYAIKFLDIQGFGVDNVSKIYGIVKEMKKAEKINFTIMREEPSAIHVRIYL